MKTVLTCCIAVLALGCASAVKVPVKVAAIPVEVGVNAAREAVLLPIHIGKDTVDMNKPKPKKATPALAPASAQPKPDAKKPAAKPDAPKPDAPKKSDKKDS